MSLASTVSSVIDVPVTHSCRAPSSPAWTDAISSSCDAKTVPPCEVIRASLGSTSAPGAAKPTAMAMPTTTATAVNP